MIYFLHSIILIFSGRPTGDRKVVDDKSAEENGDGDASPKGRRRPRRRPRKLKSKILLSRLLLLIILFS